MFCHAARRRGKKGVTLCKHGFRRRLVYQLKQLAIWADRGCKFIEFFRRILSTWLSHRDCVQLVWRGIEASEVKFGIFYGISGNKRAYWDIQNARDLLGYKPEDDAECFA